MKIFLPTLTLSALLVSSLSAQERDRDLRPARGEADQPAIEKIDWDRVKERIEGAVERGDLSRDQANQKYAELKKRLIQKPKAKRDQPLRNHPENSRQIPAQRRPDALGRVLGELIAQKKINRDDARKIFEAAYASRPQMQTRQDRPNPQGQMMEELRDVLNEAREELEEIRGARREMFEEHEERERHQHEHAERAERAERAEMLERENAERIERLQAAKKEAEMMRRRAQEAREAQQIELKKKELERYKRELMEQAEILGKQREQLQAARKEAEKQAWEKKRKSKEEKKRESKEEK